MLFYSCTNRAISKHEYELLKNSTVEIPEKGWFYGACRLNNIEKLLKGRYRFLVFKDSALCSPCYIKSLGEWESFLSEFKDGDIDLVFVLQPKKREIISAKSVLSNRKYKFPIYLDTTGIFLRMNKHIPQNEIFHSMLLDKKNKVLVIGNPLKNKEVNKIIIKEVINH